MRADFLLAAADPISHVAQHTWVKIGSGLWSFPLLSNHIVMQVLAAALLCWLIPRALRSRAGEDEIGRLVPRGLGSAIEAVCLALRKHVIEPNLGPYTNVFLPYLWSLFFFILTCNLLGLVPLGDLLGLFVDHRHLIGGTSTGNVYVTATLAVLTLVLIVYNGIRFHGLAYLRHFFLGPAYLAWFIAILEILGLAFKTMALSIRLFANMVAGHIVLAALLGFVGAVWAVSAAGGVLVAAAVIAGSVLFNLLELLVAFLQAFIFTLLTAVFFGQAVNIEHGGHGHGHSPAGDSTAPNARPEAAG